MSNRRSRKRERPEESCTAVTEIDKFTTNLCSRRPRMALPTDIVASYLSLGIHHQEWIRIGRIVNCGQRTAFAQATRPLRSSAAATSGVKILRSSFQPSRATSSSPRQDSYRGVQEVASRNATTTDYSFHVMASEYSLIRFPEFNRPLKS